MFGQEQLIFNAIIESINKTDWWMWGITAASFITSAFLSVRLLIVTKRIGNNQNEIAHRQTLLQEQVVRIEKYNLFKDELSVLYEIEFLSSLFLYDIRGILLDHQTDKLITTEIKLNEINSKSVELKRKLKSIKISGKFKTLNIDNGDLTEIELLLERIEHITIVLLSHIMLKDIISEEIISVKDDEISTYDLSRLNGIQQIIQHKGYQCKQILGHLRYFAKCYNDIFNNKKVTKIIENLIYNN